MTLKQKCAIWYIIVAWFFFSALQLTKIVDVVIGQKRDVVVIFWNIPLKFVLNMTYDFLVSSGFLYISFTLGMHALKMKNNPQQSSMTSKFLTNDSSGVKQILAASKTQSLGSSAQVTSLCVHVEASGQIMGQVKHQASINLDDLEETKSDIEEETPPTFNKLFNLTYKKESQKIAKPKTD